MLCSLIRGEAEMAGFELTRWDMSAAGLRAPARRCKHAEQAVRILAIAMVPGGFGREDAARLCGMDRRTSSRRAA
jgi:hypothetical protein